MSNSPLKNIVMSFWEQRADDAGIPLGTEMGQCPCGCRSYRVKGSGAHVSAWVDDNHDASKPPKNQVYLNHIYERVLEQASKHEIKLLAQRLMRYAEN